MQVGNGNVRKTVTYSRYIQHKYHVECRRVDIEREKEVTIKTNSWLIVGKRNTQCGGTYYKVYV